MTKIKDTVRIFRNGKLLKTFLAVYLWKNNEKNKHNEYLNFISKARFLHQIAPKLTPATISASMKVPNSNGSLSVSFANHYKPSQLELQHAYPYYTTAHGSFLTNPTDNLTDIRQNYHKCPPSHPDCLKPNNRLTKNTSLSVESKGPNHPPPTIKYG
jgi:hypothetical protein